MKLAYMVLFVLLASSGVIEGVARGGTNCTVSDNAEEAGSDYSCGATKSFIENAQIANTIGTAVSSTALSVAGQSATTKAATTGNQSAMLKANASLMSAGGAAQLTLGTASIVLGVMQYKKAKPHEDNKSKADAVSASAGKSAKSFGKEDVGSTIKTLVDTEKIVNINKAATGSYSEADTKGDAAIGARIQANSAPANAVLEVKAENLEKEAKASYKEVVKSANTISSEQGSVAKEARAGGLTSIMTGVQQMISGGLNMMAAKQLKDAAGKLSAVEGSSTVSAVTSDNFTDSSGTTISGTGTSAADTSAATDTATAATTPTLGDPQNKNLADNTPAGPAAAPKTDGGGPSGGGGAGGLSGGGTSAAGDTGTGEQSAKMDTTKSGNGYESGGGGGGFRGGSAATGGGGDKGPDLSALLAQLMPKEKDDNKNGILDYGRRLAGEEPYSPLGKDADIFKKIHEKYQEEQRRKHVGG